MLEMLAVTVLTRVPIQILAMMVAMMEMLTIMFLNVMIAMLFLRTMEATTMMKPAKAMLMMAMTLKVTATMMRTATRMGPFDCIRVVQS